MLELTLTLVNIFMVLVGMYTCFSSNSRRTVETTVTVQDVREAILEAVKGYEKGLSSTGKSQTRL